jgi:transcriptional regulator with XRE-family HTH domain
MNHDAIYKIVGDRIRARRKTLGMTQAQLAQRLEISRASLANIETGRQSVLVHNLYSIAHAIDLAPESLLPAVSVDSMKNETPAVELPTDLRSDQRKQVEIAIAAMTRGK